MMLLDPAGHDRELAAVMQGIKAGHWTGIRDLLAATSPALRTHRVELLSIAAAGTQVIEYWREEEPHSHDAHVMWASVMVDRAQRAWKVRDAQAPILETRAREECLTAAHNDTQDPVPWVRLLALAQRDVRRDIPEHDWQHREPMIPNGPWRLLRWAHERQPFNREAYHRGAQFVRALRSPESDFSAWAASISPEDSPLRVLPLYARVRLPACQEGHHAWRAEWASEPSQLLIDDAYRWFKRQGDDARLCTINDLSHVAAACWAAGRFSHAHEVFSAMEPYASLAPWRAFAGQNTQRAQELLTMAVTQSQNIGIRRTNQPAETQRG
ncbi:MULTISPECIES: hypothetical protein [unclassified Streptomyces]|uniref:hypothetical protein n=1 Tax=unclassified Streptomyces TaxID=2593676 RepID=UPI002E2E7703|nr:hypothetical protein [Streptomyces sp. NBC_01601]